MINLYESKMVSLFSILIFILGFLIHHSLQDVTSFNPLNLKLYHNLGPNQEYVPRGHISIRYGRNLVANYDWDSRLTDSELNNLKQLCRQNQVYSIKTVREDSLPLRSSEAFLKACSFINSGLTERFVVNLDHNGDFLSLSAHTDNHFCTSIDESALTVNYFNTSVFVMQTTSAPIPDTQTYIQRLEQERQEKVKGEGADNRSFLAKYWIYIVPITILLLISSASNQQEGESS